MRNRTAQTARPFVTGRGIAEGEVERRLFPVSFGNGRRALNFGRQKINLHQAGRELEPKARRPTPGSGDLCFISATPIDEVQAHLEAQGIELLEGGQSTRTGATGPITSLYFRDPDGNLIEVSEYQGGG